MTKKQEDYLETQYTLFRLSYRKLGRNQGEWKGTHHRDHMRILKRIYFTFGEKVET